MEGTAHTECQYLHSELWIAGTVCISGWTCFLIAFVFLTTALCFENKRLKKTQNEIIIFRTTSRNAILQASMMIKAPVSPVQAGPVAAANHALVPSPAPPSTTNFLLQPPPAARPVHKPIEERAPELTTSPRTFPNSFSYTPAGMPMETQISYQSQEVVNYNSPSPPPVPPRWTPSTQTYPTTH